MRKIEIHKSKSIENSIVIQTRTETSIDLHCVIKGELLERERERKRKEKEKEGDIVL